MLARTTAISSPVCSCVANARLHFRSFRPRVSRRGRLNALKGAGEILSAAVQYVSVGGRSFQVAKETEGSNPNWQGVIEHLRKALCLAVAVTILSLAVPHVAQAASSATAANSPSVFQAALNFILHLDKHLSAMIQQHGTATYAILWSIVFCETGLVFTPFLPGDSLLFAAGAFAGMGQLNLVYLFGVFMTSAVLGDAVNYAVGSKLGRWALDRKLLEQKYIKQTEAFYDKYGGKTVVLARFVPIVRTFAPFVAGIGSMTYSKFALYNVMGALIWTVLFLAAGFFFGNLPVVQHNFTLVVLGIVAVSVLPVILEVIAAKKEHGQGGGGTAAGAGA